MPFETTSRPAAFLSAKGRGTTRRAPPRRRSRRRSRAPRVPRCSSVAELVQALLVDPEVVRELVEDGDADLPLELDGVVAEVLDERPPVDHDARGEVRLLLEEA